MSTLNYRAPARIKTFLCALVCACLVTLAVPSVAQAQAGTVACTSNDDCPVAAPFCDIGGTDRCVQCLTTDNCFGTQTCLDSACECVGNLVSNHSFEQYDQTSGTNTEPFPLINPDARMNITTSSSELFVTNWVISGPEPPEAGTLRQSCDIQLGPYSDDDLNALSYVTYEPEDGDAHISCGTNGEWQEFVETTITVVKGQRYSVEWQQARNPLYVQGSFFGDGYWAQEPVQGSANFEVTVRDLGQPFTAAATLGNFFVTVTDTQPESGPDEAPPEITSQQTWQFVTTTFEAETTGDIVVRWKATRAVASLSQERIALDDICITPADACDDDGTGATQDTGCIDAAPECNTDGGAATCVVCEDDGAANGTDIDGGCSGAAPSCDETGGAGGGPICVECTVDGDCDGTDSCSSDRMCGLDSDGDDILDDVDIDDDNDGILDLQEAVEGDIDADTDGDMIPNRLDLDSDNDGIADIVEGGGFDRDGDGRVDYPTEGDPTTMTDADSDGLSEDLAVDTDGDGTPDLAADAGSAPGDGTNLPVPNTDGTFRADFLDIDADDDGIPDSIEGQSTLGYTAPLSGAAADADADGYNDAYDPDNDLVAGPGDGPGTPLTPPNTDTPADRVADWLDEDSDQDGLSDADENGEGKATALGTDSDDDGLDDAWDDVDGADVNDDVAVPATDLPDDDSDVNDGGDVDYRDAGCQDSTTGTGPDSGCTAPTPECDTDTNGTTQTCVTCQDDAADGQTDGGCTTGTPACGTTGAGAPVCVECLVDADCSSGTCSDVNTCGLDSDGDGVPDDVDIDDDNDGIPDLIENGGLAEDQDFDGDMVPNRLDLDSDNDGIPDVVEANARDNDRDGRVNYPINPETGLEDPALMTDTDGDGLSEDPVLAGNRPADADIGNPTPSTNLPITNNDSNGGDGPDYLDIDADDDGIPDNVEAQGTLDYIAPLTGPGADADGDGYNDAYDPNDDTVPGTGDGSGTIVTLPNSDNLGRFDGLDTDSDEDQIPDASENGDPQNAALGSDSDGDGLDDAWDDVDGFDPNDDIDDPATDLPDGDGDLNDGGDVDFRDQPQCVDDNSGATADTGCSGATPECGTSGNSGAVCVVCDNDATAPAIDGGCATGTPVCLIAALGAPVCVECDANDQCDGGEACDLATGSCLIDSDGDEVPDATDLDDDNDGIPDVDEAPNRNGGDVDADFDGDGIPNRLDLDSDNDGIADITEGGGRDGDRDGRVDYPVAGDPTSMTDADGDGLSEDPAVTGGLSPDTDPSGPTAGTNLPLPNSDGNPVDERDFLDIDADDDGIPDNIEAQTTLGYTAPEGGDGDGDGFDDAYDPNDDTSPGAGDGSGIPVPLPNSDSEAGPDYIDTDAEGDTIADVLENGEADALLGTDADSDGLDDAFDDVDGPDVNDDITTPATDLPDSDGDVNDVGGDVDYRDAPSCVDDMTGSGVDAGCSDTTTECDVTLPGGGTCVVCEDDAADGALDGGCSDGAPACLEGGAAGPICLECTANADCETGDACDSNNTCGVDTDGDGVPDTDDLDDDNDGVPDADEAVGGDPDADSDMDGIPNRLDLDSDGDAIPDITEAGGIDTDGDGRVDYPTAGDPTSMTDADGDGLSDDPVVDTDDDGVADLAADTDTGVAAPGTNLPIPNTDGNPNDAVDFLDIDADDDGIPDVVEAQPTLGYALPGTDDADQDGLVDAVDPNDDNTAGPNDGPGTPLALTNSDMTGLPDFQDTDSDGDGLLDVDENGDDDRFVGADDDNDGLDDAFDDVDGRDIDDDVSDANPPAVAFPDGDADVNDGGDVDYRDAACVDDNTGSTVDSGCADATPECDADTAAGQTTCVICQDDATAPAIDGGCSDTAPICITGTDGPTCLECTIDADCNADERCDATNMCNGDSDDDGIPDAIDLDDDNDGIPDPLEAPAGDPDLDTDMDGIPNRLDLDSDGDGIPDITEAGGIDTDGDGRVDYPTPGDPMSMTDADDDGLSDDPVVDTDDDGVADQPADTDTTGPADGTNLATPNSDNSAVDGPDFLDIDADDDGIPDVVEAQPTLGYAPPNGTDDNRDGLSDDVAATPLPLTDTDEDGTPDYLDTDSDDDTVSDAEENGEDANAPLGADDDNDGLDNAFDDVDGFDADDDITDPATDLPDTDGDVNDLDGDVDYRDIAVDTDGDGVPDVRDLDDDNDGIPDALEAPADDPDLDSDEDGIPNRLDLDSDGDGIPDITEAGGIDTDSDGRVDYPVLGDPTSMTDDDGDGLSDDPVVDTDGNGVADLAPDTDTTGPAAGTNLPVPNSDGNPLDGPDFIDIDADDDGIPDVIEAQPTLGYAPFDPADNDMDGLADALTTGPLPLTDTDNDRIPDYIDTDSDDDGLSDAEENNETANVVSGVDLDMDGLDDAFDDNLATRDIDDDINDPSTDLPDTDGDVNDADGDVDYRDIAPVCVDDAPGNGLDTGCSVETPICDDSRPEPLCVECVNNGQCPAEMCNSGVCGGAALLTDDTATTPQDTTVLVNVLGNDAPLGLLTLNAVEQLANGMVLIDPVSGTVTYTPNPGLEGEDRFTYEACLGSLCAEAIVIVTVTPVDNAPQTNPDSASTPLDTPVTVSVLDNDVDPEDGPLTALTVGQPEHGDIVLNDDGTVTHTPDPGYTGPDAAVYTVCDAAGNCSQESVSFNVGVESASPVLDDEDETTPEDTPIVIPVLDGDTDPDGGDLRLDSVTDPTNGTVIVNDDGTVTYTPDNDFVGEDSFTYTACDEVGDCVTATVTATVTPGDDPPVAVDDEAQTTVATPVTVTPFDNDIEPDDEPLSFGVIGTPSNGTVDDNGDGTLTYTPEAGFVDVDRFDYEACDATGTCVTATVVVTVTDSANGPPDAMDDTDVTPINTPLVLDVLDGDTDPDSDPLHVSQVVQPEHGTVTLNDDGTLTYTPDDGYQGPDAFTYVACDPLGQCDEATVTLTVGEPNDAPTIVGDEATTPEDTLVVVFITNNDSDPDGDALTVDDIVEQPANGSVVRLPDGGLLYTPDPNFVGEDVFVVRVCDTAGNCDEQLVVVTVTPVHDAPIANDDRRATPLDTAVGVDVLANDEDPDQDTLTVTFVGTSTDGTATLENDGTVLFTPASGFVGEAMFVYVIADPEGSVAQATVTVVVGGDNANPDAVDDTATIDEDDPNGVVIDVIDNDTDPDGAKPSVTETTDPPNGTVTINPNGTLTYVPDPDFSGEDIFTYTACDTDGVCDTATVTVTVNPSNDPPVAADDEVTTPVDTPITIPVLDNDSDPDEDPLRIRDTGFPSDGDVVINSDGTVTYTPDPGLTGIDMFSVVISDGNGGTAMETVIVHVDPDANEPPVADDDEGTTPVDEQLLVDILGNDNDPDGDPLTVHSLTQPEHGTVILAEDGTVLYSPEPGYEGPDSFTYQACDDHGNCDTADVTLTVGDGNAPPQAIDDEATTPEDTAVILNVVANDTDPEGEPVTVGEIVEQPKNGTVVLNDAGTLTYTPNPNFNGDDVFSVTVCDPAANCAEQLVSVAVTSVDDAPIAGDDSVGIPLDAAVTVTVLDNDSDPDGDMVSVVEAGDPPNGTVGVNDHGAVTYRPDGGFEGEDSFPYTITDPAGNVAMAVVTVVVGGDNVGPTANDDPADALEDGGPVVIDVLTNDDDPDGGNDDLVVSQVTDPHNGVVTISPDGTLTYTPDPEFAGDDTFAYTVCDAAGLCDTATVTVTVAPDGANDPPVALDDEVSTPVNVPVAIAALDNDSDPDGDIITVDSFTQPSDGVATELPDGTFLYIPNVDFVGDSSFGVTITDGNGGTATETVRIHVDATPNGPPEATDDVVDVTADTPLVLDLLGNDIDPDGDPLTITELVDPEHGSLELLPDGTVRYTPDPGYEGPDSFTYEVCDDHGQCDTATVEVTVGPAGPTATNALDDQAETLQGRGVLIDVVNNDGDGPLTVRQITEEPENGTVVVNGDGTVTHTPAPHFIGTDVFEYEVCAEAIGNALPLCATALVVATVTPGDDAPTAVDDRATTPLDTPVSVAVLGNDYDENQHGISLTSVGDAQDGTTVINADQSITFTPNEGFTGTTTFTYLITDSTGDEATAVVTTDVGVDNGAPTATDDEVTLTEGDEPLTVDVLGNDSDPDDDPLTVDSVTPPLHGTVTIEPDGTLTYTPDGGFEGEDMFTYTVCDDQGDCTTATVTVTVDGIEDPPIAVDDNDVTEPATAVMITVLDNDFDPDGDLVNVVEVGDPDVGTATLAATGVVTYTPPAGFTGVARFPYTIADGNGGEATAVVRITVLDGGSQPPVAEDDRYLVPKDAPSNLDVRENDSEPDGQPFAITQIVQPENGTATRSPDGTLIVFTPNPGFSGRDFFFYEICDSDGLCDRARVDLVIGDSDDDGIPDDVETAIGTDPFDSDSDDDGIPDGLEISAGDPLVYDEGLEPNPLDKDTDDDGISDGDEVDGAFTGGDPTDPLDPDSDQDSLSDGIEVGVVDPIEDSMSDGPTPVAILGTDSMAVGWMPDADPQTTTDPLDDDTDDDGIIDGAEDADGSGSVDNMIGGTGTDGDGETDPNQADTDSDGILDGTELGLDAPQGDDTDPAVFVADADPSTVTDPLDIDTDDGSVADGAEDLNGNGQVDEGERDPNLFADDLGGNGVLVEGGACSGGGSSSLPWLLVLMAGFIAIRRRRLA